MTIAPAEPAAAVHLLVLLSVRAEETRTMVTVQSVEALETMPLPMVTRDSALRRPAQRALGNQPLETGRPNRCILVRITRGSFRDHVVAAPWASARRRIRSS